MGGTEEEETMIPGMEVRWTTGDWPKPGVFWPGDVQPGRLVRCVWRVAVTGGGGGQNVHFWFFFKLLFGRGAGGCLRGDTATEAGAVEEGSEGNGSMMTSPFLLLASRLRGSSLH